MPPSTCGPEQSTARGTVLQTPDPLHLDTAECSCLVARGSRSGLSSISPTELNNHGGDASMLPGDASPPTPDPTVPSLPLVLQPLLPFYRLDKLNWNSCHHPELRVALQAMDVAGGQSHPVSLPLNQFGSYWRWLYVRELSRGAKEEFWRFQRDKVWRRGKVFLSAS